MDSTDPQRVQFLSDAEFNARKLRLMGMVFPLLSQGSIQLIEMMGSDRRIVEAARTTSGIGGKGEKEDRHLIRYLMRHRHSTPVEFCDLTFKIRCPMDLWRQWIRHRTASVNEFSTRYSEVPDNYDKTPTDKWRLQSTGNRQGSGGYLNEDFPETLVVRPTYEEKDGSGVSIDDTLLESELAAHKGWGVFRLGNREIQEDDTLVLNFPKLTRAEITAGLYLTEREKQLHVDISEVYDERLEFGVAKEQARKDLPLATYTEAWWKCDLHNLLHFLGLRMDPHAQLEIRSYATVMGEQIIAQLFPVVWEAFLDYRLHAISLSRLDQAVISLLSAMRRDHNDIDLSPTSKLWPPDWRVEKSRERDECIAKLKRLELLPLT